MRKVSDHVRKVHKVPTTTDTIANYVKQKIRR
jgi:predicted small metal-binding protein